MSDTEVMIVVPLVEVRLMLLELRELPEIRLLSVEIMVMSPDEVRLLAMFVPVLFEDLNESVS